MRMKKQKAREFKEISKTTFLTRKRKSSSKKVGSPKSKNQSIGRFSVLYQIYQLFSRENQKEKKMSSLRFSK